MSKQPIVANVFQKSCCDRVMACVVLQDFFGVIEEMRVWKTVRTPEQIRTAMAADDGRGPGRWWRAGREGGGGDWIGGRGQGSYWKKPWVMACAVPILSTLLAPTAGCCLMQVASTHLAWSLPTQTW